MRTSIVIALLAGMTLVAGTLIHFAGKKASQAPPPVADSASKGQMARRSPAAFPTPEAPSASPSGAEEAGRDSINIETATEPISDAAADPAPHPTPFSRAIDTLVSSQASFQQKHESWRQ